jgi:hypothetical protein
MTGSTPYPPGFGAPPPGNSPPPAPGGPGYPPQGYAAPGPSPRPPKSRTGLLAAGVALAVLLGVAALVLSIINAVHGPDTPPPPNTPAVAQQELFVDDADKPLCEAIAPLMKESDEKNHALTDSGAPGSPERSAAIPDFKKHTLDWAQRMQKIINEHADPPRYLTRTLQAYVDGSLLYSENIYPDRPPDSFDGAVWDSAAVAYGGPLGTCYKLGIKW